MTRPSDSRSAPLPVVHLTEGEWVVARGTRRTVHRIRVEESWVAAASIPTARVKAHDPCRGTVWEREIEVALAPGTLVERIDEDPVPAAGADAIDFLRRGAAQSQRRLRRRHFRVEISGRLRQVVD